MKSILAVALALCLLLSLVSCSSEPMGGANDENNYAPGDPGYNGDDAIEGGIPDQDRGEAEQLPPSGFAENPFIATQENNISTFSADVDTASYAYFRKLVQTGTSLQTLRSYFASSFRTEEFINYFDYETEQPTEGELFGVRASMVDCPWNPDTVLMRLTLQAEAATEPCGNNLVFLIDVSGSMYADDKLPLLKKAFSCLVGALDAHDTISIVTYSGKEEVVLDGCSGDRGAMILGAIESLRASGSTNGEAGLSEAYRIAQKHFIEGGNNRIIMASDGDLNVGISSADQLKAFVAEKRDAGIYLSVLGFGTGNYRDDAMEALADNGNGIYYYIDGESEAERVLGSDLMSTLYTVAKDVKLQITFDPQYISSYRLIGYENRILGSEDFADDTKDGGEVGAGHTLTVCYELTLTERSREAQESWMTLAVRYKDPHGENPESVLREYGIGSASLAQEADADMRFLACVIRTVMLLHNSAYLGNTTLAAVIEELESLDLTAYPDRAEFLALLRSIAQ